MISKHLIDAHPENLLQMWSNLAVYVSPAGLGNNQIRIRRLTPPAEIFRPLGLVITATSTRLTRRCVGVDSTLCYRRFLPCEIAASIQKAIIDCLIGNRTGTVYQQCSQGSVGTGKDQAWAIRYIGTRRQAGPAENLVYCQASPVSDDSRRSANSRPFGMNAGTDEGRHHRVETNQSGTFEMCTITNPFCRLLLCIAFFSPIVNAQSQPPLPSIRVSGDKLHFVDSNGKTFRVWGVNYDHDDAGLLLEDYWVSDWPRVEEDFAEIKAIGANVVRVHLQVARFMSTAHKPNDAALHQLGELVRLAERMQLYLDITGLGCYHKADLPEWYDPLDEAARWEVQSQFWRAVAETCKASSAVFCYDLMNEPILPGEKPEPEWLAGELAGKHFVQRLSLDLKGRTREQVARDWVKKMTDAIREIDSGHMITVGVIPWAHVFPGAKPLFYAPSVCGPLDFVSVHFYPKAGEVQKAIDALNVYKVGKPIVVEEFFPLACSLEEAAEFVEKSDTNGFVSFYWGKTIEQNEQAGDIRGAIIAKWLRYFRDQADRAKGP